MASVTVRKAIQDAVLKVRDTAKALGPKAAVRADWRVCDVPASIPASEENLYRETYKIAAEHAAMLLAEFN